MKNKLLLLLGLLQGYVVYSQNLPPYLPTNGLVGWWPFNGNANDESGNGNHGIVNGATLGSDRYSNANSAYYFNGSQSIVVPDASSFQLNYVTLSVWFRTSDQSASSLLYKTDSGALNEQFACELNYTSASTNLWSVKNGNNCTNPGIGWQEINFDSSLFDNSWHNIICTYDGVISNMYLDGNLVATSAFSIGVIDPCGGELNIGKAYNSAHYFDGSIDDIGIWNRALTQQEVVNLYAASIPPPCNPLPTNLTAGLVGYWPFCGNANDESGNGNNAIVNGAMLTNDRFGSLNSAYDFNRSLNDGIDYTSVTQLYPSLNSYSLSVWFNSIDDSYSEQDVIRNGCYIGTGNLGYCLYLSDHFGSKKISFDVGGSGLSGGYIHADDISPLQDSTWYHVVATVDRNANVLTLYINGQMVDTADISLLGDQSNSDPIWMGKEYIFNGNSFGGVIDDFCFWNRALSSQEVSQLYNQNICYQTITVTDTLLINVHLTGLNPVTYQNTIRVYPNPAGDHITVDFGSNYASLNGYSLRIENTLGQVVFTSPVQQQSSYIDLNSWSGVGVYFVYLLDNLGHTIDVRKIILQ